MIGFYSYLRRGDQVSLLAGPFADKATAEDVHPAALERAVQIEPLAWFSESGTVRIDSGDRALPSSKLSAQLGHVTLLDPL